VSGCSDGTIGLWDINVETPQLNILSKFKSSIFDLAWSPDEQMIAAACEDGKIRVWSFRNKKVTILDAHKAGVNSVAWSPDGKTLASASADQTIILWDSPVKGKPRILQTIQGHLHAVNSIVWSHDGKLLASAAHKTVKIWNPHGSSEKPLQILETQPDTNGFVKSITFSHDRKFLAAKCQSSDVPANNVVRIWDCNTWQLVATLPEPTTSRAANGIAFHPTELILATQGENDRVIRLWNLEALFQELYNLKFEIDISSELIVNQIAERVIRITNQGTATWKQGYVLKATCELEPIDEEITSDFNDESSFGDFPLGQQSVNFPGGSWEQEPEYPGIYYEVSPTNWSWTSQLDRDVQPGGNYEFQVSFREKPEGSVLVPGLYEMYWTVQVIDEKSSLGKATKAIRLKLNPVSGTEPIIPPWIFGMH
ncbi:MAG: WD40 repeat domain-containing protein, partial [Cyanobacteriota bacterium]